MADQRNGDDGHALGSKRHRQGFTLLELMLTLGVAAILVTAAVPFMGNMLARQRLKAAEGEWMAALRFAQSQAIARGQAVVILKGNNDHERIVQLESSAEVLRQFYTDARLEVLPSNELAANPDQAIRFMGTGNARRGALAVCAPHLSGENTVDIFFWAASIETRRREGGAGCSIPDKCMNMNVWECR